MSWCFGNVRVLGEWMEFTCNFLFSFGYLLVVLVSRSNMFWWSGLSTMDLWYGQVIDVKLFSLERLNGEETLACLFLSWQSLAKQGFELNLLFKQDGLRLLSTNTVYTTIYH
jgi:hypothetical protein